MSNLTEALLTQALDNSCDLKDSYAKDLATGTTFKIDGIGIDPANLKAGSLFLLTQEMGNKAVEEQAMVVPSNKKAEGIQSFIRNMR